MGAVIGTGMVVATGRGMPTTKGATIYLLKIVAGSSPDCGAFEEAPNGCPYRGAVGQGEV